jgi:NADPH-dependent 2,4-dienoyl-CoA reductase/sulfur reductase-like enzyme
MSAASSVAVARARAGEPFRTSVTGEPRAPLCGMGVCYECRVTLAGEAHQLACMLPDDAPPAPAPRRHEACDVLVVGGGPAGLAAARAAGASGADVLLVDEHPTLGGPIWRAAPERVRAPARVCPGARVVAATPDGLLVEDRAGAIVVRFRRLVVATGARELFLPFPGWTLPGVLGAGGLQLLAKGGWPVAGKRVVVAGTGPLLRAAAAALRRRGAHVAGVAELAPRGRIARFGLGLARHPAKLAHAAALSATLAGVPIWTEAWVRRAHGDGHVTAVDVAVRGRTRTIACDLVAVGFGLVPAIELPLLLGCGVAGGRVVVDDLQATTVPGVYCAGEATGIGGVDKAVVEGEIAGLAASGHDADARRRFGRRRRAHAFAAALAACFPPPRDWAAVVDDDTIVCRCEDVRWGAVRAAADLRSARLHTRLGMGACQGRVCGAALAVLRGFPPGAVRPPLAPARLETLTR